MYTQRDIEELTSCRPACGERGKKEHARRINVEARKANGKRAR